MRTIRLARQADVDDLLAIYAPYLSTTVTFEYVLPSREEFSRRIADVQARFPYLVLEEDGQPVGYAYAHPLGQLLLAEPPAPPQLLKPVFHGAPPAVKK